MFQSFTFSIHSLFDAQLASFFSRNKQHFFAVFLEGFLFHFGEELLVDWIQLIQKILIIWTHLEPEKSKFIAIKNNWLLYYEQLPHFKCQVRSINQTK